MWLVGILVNGFVGPFVTEVEQVQTASQLPCAHTLLALLVEANKV